MQIIPLSCYQKAINEAILTENKPSKPDGLYHCASFVLLDQKELSGTPTVDSSDHTQMVTVYGLALHQGFGYSGGTFHDISGSHIPVAITFEIVGGKYVLKEYWTPRDGSYYVRDVGISSLTKLRTRLWIRKNIFSHRSRPATIRVCVTAASIPTQRWNISLR